MQRSTIGFIYRDDGDGKGLHWDQTCLAAATAEATGGRRLTPLTHDSIINDVAGAQSRPDDTIGLLVIPGKQAKNTEYSATRQVVQKELLEEALREGRPVLGFCGGSLDIWTTMGGRTRPCVDHAYSKMVNLGKGDLVVNNVPMHDVVLHPGSLLRSAATKKTLRNVNSVHSITFSETDRPSNLVITANAVANPGIVMKNRQGETRQPETSPEGFESAHSAPIMGCLWHPEAYAPDQLQDHSESRYHVRIIAWMAKAGDAFVARRLMVAQMKQKGCHMIAQMRRVAKARLLLQRAIAAAIQQRALQMSAAVTLQKFARTTAARRAFQQRATQQDEARRLSAVLRLQGAARVMAAHAQVRALQQHQQREAQRLTQLRASRARQQQQGNRCGHRRDRNYRWGNQHGRGVKCGFCRVEV